MHLVYPLSQLPAENGLMTDVERALRHYKNCAEFTERLKDNRLVHSMNYANAKV